MYRPYGRLRGGAISLADANKVFDLDPTKTSYDLNSLNTFVNLYYPTLSDPLASEYGTAGTFTYVNGSTAVLPTAGTSIGLEYSWYGLANVRFSVTNSTSTNIVSRLLTLITLDLSKLYFRIRGVTTSDSVTFTLTSTSQFVVYDQLRNPLPNSSTWATSARSFTVTPPNWIQLIGGLISGNQYILEWYVPTLASGVATLDYVALQNSINGYMDRLNTLNQQISTLAGQKSTLDQEVVVSSLASAGMITAKGNALINRNISCGVYSSAVDTYNGNASTLSSYQRAYSSQVTASNSTISSISASMRKDQSTLDTYDPKYSTLKSTFEGLQIEYSTNVYKQIGYSYNAAVTSSVQQEMNRYYIDGTNPCIGPNQYLTGKVRYVRIQNTPTRTTVIALTQIAAFVGAANIALNKPVTFKSETWSGAKVLTNGIMVPQNHPNLYSSNTQTADEYVEVDLGAEYDLDTIVIVGRYSLTAQQSDGCQLILRNNNGDNIYRTLLTGAVGDIYTIRPNKLALPGSTTLIVSPQIQSTLEDRMNKMYSTSNILADTTRLDYKYVDQPRLKGMISIATALNTSRATYFCKLSSFMGISSIRAQMLSSLEATRVSTGVLASTVSTLDGNYAILTQQYISSLDELTASQGPFEVLSASTAYAKAYTNEQIALSTLSRLEENLAILQTALDTLAAGNQAEANSLFDSRLYQTTGPIPMVGGATQADIDLAIKTQMSLITTATTEYQARIQRRIDAEAEVTAKRDTNVQTTEQSFSNKIAIALSKFSTNVELSTLLRGQLNTLSSLYLLITPQRITDTFINQRVQSTIDGVTAMRQSVQTEVDKYYANQVAAERALADAQIEQAYTKSKKDAIEAQVEQIKSKLKENACNYLTASMNYDSINAVISSTAASLNLPIETVAPLATISTLACDSIPAIQMGGSPMRFPGSRINTSTLIQNISTLSDAEIRKLYSNQTLNLTQFANTISTYTSYYRSLRDGDLIKAGTAVQEVSTAVNREISKRKMEVILANPNNFMSSLEVVDSNITLLRNFRNIQVNNFITTVIAERGEFARYIAAKRDYDRQSVYQMTREIEASTMTTDQFEAVKSRYDMSVQYCNHYISQRSTFFTTLMIEYNKISSLIRAEFRDAPYTAKDISTSTLVAKIPPRFPLVMNLSTIPPRPIHFIKGGLAPKDITVCDPTSLLSTVAIDRTEPVAPTTTADVRQCGIALTQSVVISHPTNGFQLRQIMVIDKTGKNVAFGRPVSLIGSGFTTALANAQRLTNGTSYSPPLLRELNDYTFSEGAATNPRSILITLQAPAEVTAVRLIKPSGSAYSLLNTGIALCSDPQGAVVLKQTASPYNSDDVTVDVRPKDAPATCPIVYLPTRRGVCGYLARYVKIEIAPDQSARTYQFSQIVVLNSAGENLCLTSIFAITPYLSGIASSLPQLGVLIDGIYRTRTMTELGYTMQAVANNYILVDLGTENDVAAVQVYNAMVGDSLSTSNAGNKISLLNAEKLEIASGITVSNGPRDTIDFRYSGSDANCPIKMAWESYYGEAGIKARYVTFTRGGGFTIRTCRLINRNGKNIAFGATITGIDSAILGYDTSTTEYTTTATMITIDLGYVTEICGIYLAGSKISQTEIRIKVDQTSSGAWFMVGFTATEYSQDTRYDPAVSPYPYLEDIRTRPYKTGTFGIYTQTVMIETRNSDITAAKVVITDATGKDAMKALPTLTTTSFNGVTYATFSFTRQWEVNAVLLDSTIGSGRKVLLKDCNGVIVQFKPASVQDSSGKFYADFRTQKAPAERGPLTPYTVTDGPHRQGVPCRYIKVIPRDSTTPLYLSQVIAINACGRNVAEGKDAYATSGANPQRAVDGFYERQLDNPSEALTLYDNYRSNNSDKAFTSGTGNPATNYWIVDLGRFIDTSSSAPTNQKCKNQITINACQTVNPNSFSYMHEINCVIVIAATDKRSETKGVIVQLLDENGVVVGIQKVNDIVGTFGVDFLDFRRDTSASLADAIAEPPPRVIETGYLQGTTPAGVMIQYVRIESAIATLPIKLSQLFVLDISGRNVALYKPTTSSETPDLSYRAVDGNYFIRSDDNAFVATASGSQFLEVNLTCPQPVTKAYIIPTITYTTSIVDATAFQKMRIKFLNSARDVIAVQTATDPTQPVVLGSGSSTSFTLNKSAGVNIVKTVLDRKYDEDQIPAGVSGGPAATAAASVPAIWDPPFDITTPLRRGASAHAGVMATYLRILNPGNYIQISQIMVFDATLTNIARTLPADNVFATHALPDRQPERAVDGAGGYFHQPRTEDQCYVSEKKAYEFWQLRLGTAPVEIIGLKYIPPSSNRSRSQGLRFQLLDANQNVCAQYVVDNPNFSEQWIDFRLKRTSMVPISQVCMPKLSTHYKFQIGLPFGLTQDAAGNIYATDYKRHTVIRWTYNSTTGLSSAPSKIFGTEDTPGGGTTGFTNPTGIFLDPLTNILFVCDYGNNRICGLRNFATGQATLAIGDILGGINSPYGLCVFGTTMFITEYLPQGRILSCYGINSLSTVGLNQIGTYSYPASLAVRQEGSTQYLYCAIGGGAKIQCILPSLDPTRDIGIGTAGINTQVTIDRTAIYLQFPTGITLDPTTNILFFVDSVANKVYYVPPDVTTSTRAQVSLLAGSGAAGYIDTPSAPAIQGTFDAPLACMLHQKTGDLFITDLNNISLRRVNTSTVPMITTFIDKVKGPDPGLMATTTIPGTNVELQIPTTQQIQASRDLETIVEFAAPAMMVDVGL